MSVGQRSVRHIALLSKSLQPNSTRLADAPPTFLSHPRTFTSAAVAALETIPTSEEPVNIAATFPSSQPYRIAASVVLSRPPLLTRDIPDFENAFYFYQRRLNDRLSLPFTRYFYFKKRTLAEAEYKKRQARIKDEYNPYKEGWKDELLVGDYRWKQEDFGYQRLLETTVTGDEAAESENAQVGLEGDMSREIKNSMERPLSRITEADLKNDTKSLDRKQSRTLYLLVRRNRESNAWKFPQVDLVGRENLKEAAMRGLVECCGVNMNTWFVGNVPIGHYIYKYPEGYRDSEGDYLGKKVFFMKARMLAGQANLEKNIRGIVDFQWLTKEEIHEVAGKKYFTAVRHMLVSQ
ncbi:39S mitochondrial ribosomal protein L46-domain-containing protein [Kalaharituber pfeilii]|nr:39S mitochondrial ribosomal protein L46-domain-containing protein [Kalaharituber pfeilii]